MTMPHLSNCPHQGDGWCLNCVKELYEKTEIFKGIKVENISLSIPEPIPESDIKLERLIIICEQYKNFVASDDYYEDNNFENYIFKEAIDTIYGNGFWDWYNITVNSKQYEE